MIFSRISLSLFCAWKLHNYCNFSGQAINSYNPIPLDLAEIEPQNRGRGLWDLQIHVCQAKSQGTDCPFYLLVTSNWLNKQAEWPCFGLRNGRRDYIIYLKVY